MTTPTPSQDPSGAARWAWVGRAAADFRAGVRTATPWIVRAGRAFGQWLAALSWRHFWLLALLLFMAGAGLKSIGTDGPGLVVVDDRHAVSPVDVNVVVSPRGISIEAPGGPATAAAPAAGAAPTAATAPAAAAPPAPPQPPVAARGAAQRVTIDSNGIHILADERGRPVAIELTKNGIQVDRERPLSGAAAPAADAGTLVVPAAALDDPQRVQAAVEAARAQIEQIVRDQVERRVARLQVSHERERADWVMSLVFVAIVFLVIQKVLLGSKSKAEDLARVATANAAEEGLKRQLVEANLKMMQAQVEPHFLFNTLASVDYLIETDAPRASRMQKNLIQYLRAALPQMRGGSTTLGKEVALCRSYLEILKVRMEERLQFAINVPQGLLAAQFPPMVLQTLVENAIKHGLEPKPQGGTLTLAADVAHGSLRVTVADTGLGFGVAAQPGGGVGLDNVRERLAALFGGAAQLAIEANSPSGTIARIEVPYAAETDSAARSALAGDAVAGKIAGVS